MLKQFPYKILLLFCLMLSYGEVKAAGCCNPCTDDPDCCNPCGAKSVIEFRGAYLRPDSSNLRDIYGQAWFDFGIEGNAAFYNYYMLFLGLDYTFNDGESLGEREPTQISIFPLTVGLKATVRYDYFQPYVGIGPAFIWTWIENDTYNPALDRNVNFFTVGGIVKVGSYFFVNDVVSLSIFLDYTFARKKFSSCSTSNVERHNITLNNLKVGAGLGVYF